jgi:hypothetical protein
MRYEGNYWLLFWRVVSLKTDQLHEKWHAMWAGKIGQRTSVLTKIRHDIPASNCTVEELASICKEAYIEYQRHLAFEKVLSPFGMNLQEFINKRVEIGEAQYQQMWNSIAGIQVGFDMLVYGFDKYGIARIFLVSSPTEENPSFITFVSDSRFASIGTGSYLADSTLYAYGQSPGLSLEETIYCVLSAKFLSESASDVGEYTYLKIMRPNGTCSRMDVDFIFKKIKGHWEKYSKPRLLDRDVAIVRGALKDMTIVESTARNK